MISSVDAKPAVSIVAQAETLTPPCCKMGSLFESVSSPFRVNLSYFKNKIFAVLSTSTPQKKDHRIARTEKPEEYPNRQTVPDSQIAWSTPFPDYQPQYYVSPIVLKFDSTIVKGGWADPEDSSFMVNKIYESFEGPVTFDSRGFPLNPRGRTGLAGRGLLGKWGPSFAADSIVTRIHPGTGKLELLVVLRKDCHQWAIPGGMVDKGELITKTLARELEEETSIKLQLENAVQIYEGYVDDRRNTDNAWVETTASHIHLDAEHVHLHDNPVAGDDAMKAKWIEITPNLSLYGSHSDLIRKTLSKFQSPSLPEAVQIQIQNYLQE